MTESHTGRYHEMQDQIDMKNPLDIHLQCQRSLHLGGIHDFFYISYLRYLSADVPILTYFAICTRIKWILKNQINKL